MQERRLTLIRRSVLERGDGLSRQVARACCDDRTAEIAGHRVEFPIARETAGAGDDRYNSGNIVNLQVPFHDQVQPAHRQKPVGITLAIILGALYRAAERGVIVELAVLKHRERPSTKPRLTKGAVGCDPNGGTVVRGKPVRHAEPALAGERLLDKADDRPPFVQEADDRAELRPTCDE